MRVWDCVYGIGLRNYRAERFADRLNEVLLRALTLSPHKWIIMPAFLNKAFGIRTVLYLSLIHI